MTGGNVVVLGRTGRNFAAGMCGGFAYVLDLDGNFPSRVNPERVDLQPLSSEDEEIIQRMVRRHFEYTRSRRAEDVLRKWNTFAPKFVKVFPRDLKMALDARLAAGSGDG
jgi:glutamate synthase domain-containing protein 3